MSLSCPLPGGIYIPVFSAGAVFGQLYQIIMFRILYALGSPEWVETTSIYAILGGCGITSAITKTISVAILMCELMGSMREVIPIMICVLSAFITSTFIDGENYFNMLSAVEGLVQQVSLKESIIVQDMLEINPHYSDDLKSKYLSLQDSTF